VGINLQLFNVVNSCAVAVAIEIQSTIESILVRFRNLILMGLIKLGNT
jgi:hypothetical protein